MGKILAEGRAVGVGDLATQDGNYLIIDLIFPNMPQGLDEGAALPARGGHVPRRGVLEEDFTLSDPDLTCWAVGEKNDAGWNLIRKAEHVRSIGAGWLDPNGVPSHQGASNGICGGSNDPKHGILSGVIVKSSGELPDGACGPKAAQAGINGRTTAKTLEMLRSKYPTPPVAVNPATDL